MHNVHYILSYFMVIYTISTIYYLLRTKCIGTPFKDSLTDKQKKIKEEQSKLRYQIFVEGLLLGFVGVVVYIKVFT